MSSFHILPIDELHDFSRGLLHHQPDLGHDRAAYQHISSSGLRSSSPHVYRVSTNFYLPGRSPICGESPCFMDISAPLLANSELPTFAGQWIDWYEKSIWLAVLIIVCDVQPSRRTDGT